MSNYIGYQPTGGTGNASINVSAKTLNDTYAAKSTTLTVRGGDNVRNVNVIQHYRPALVQFASTNVPATGGTIYATMHSEYYDVVFRSVPSFVTIQDTTTGTYYVEGQVIAGDDVDGHTFGFIVGANPDTTQRVVSNTFNMGHYLNGTIAQSVSYINLTQDAAAEAKYIAVSPTILELDYFEGIYTSITVTTNAESLAAVNSNTNAFGLTPTGFTGSTALTFFTNSINNTGQDKTGNVVVSDLDGYAAPATVQVRQKYVPTIQQGASAVPVTGGTITVHVSTEYNIAFLNIPSYVSIVDDNGDSYTSGQIISSAVANGDTFYLTFDANTSAAPRTNDGTFVMAHYLNGTEQDITSTIQYTQPGMVYNLSVSPTSITLDYFADLASTIAVTSNIPSLGVSSDQAAFLVSPATLTGSGNVTLFTSSINNSVQDRTGTITITPTGGQTSPATVSVRQRYAPIFNQLGGSTIPYTGGTITCEISTEYDVTFTGIPYYCTIEDGDGTTYGDGDIISPATANNTLFYITFDQNNTHVQRSSDGTFVMGHYINGTLQDSTVAINYVQEAEQINYYITGTPSSLIFDYTGGSRTITIDTNIPHGVSVSSGDFSVSPDTGLSGDSITVSATAYTGYTDLEGSVVLQDTIGQLASPAVLDVVQYFEPYFEHTGSQYFPATGGVLPFVIETKYDVEFASIPAWITIWNEDRTETFAEADIISPSTADITQFILEVAPNDSSSQRDSGQFRMLHHLNGSIAPSSKTFLITQAGV